MVTYPPLLRRLRPDDIVFWLTTALSLTALVTAALSLARPPRSDAVYVEPSPATLIAAEPVADASEPAPPPTPPPRTWPVIPGTNLPTRAGVFTPLACEPAWDQLRFWDPVHVEPLPGDEARLVVVERRGTLQLIDPRTNPPRKRELLDIAAQVFRTPEYAEEGLLGLAFHPQFAWDDSPHRGEFFLCYTARTPEGRTNRVSRWRMCEGSLDVADPHSEEVLIDQPDERLTHNGGCLRFGPDGCLYVSLGDDGPADPPVNPQTIERNLFSGILRLDVDCRGGDFSHPPPRQPLVGRTAGYYIPHDNPFVGEPNALEEFFALGLRNPWRMSFDSAGRLWVSDPGDRRREEINIVRSGANCGWAYLEGTLLTRSFNPHAPQRPAAPLGRETAPVFEYQRSAMDYCPIGGHVYRGQQFPELRGKYIYADQGGRIFALEVDDQDRLVEHTLLAVCAEAGLGLVSVGLDQAGEPLFCSIQDLGSETGRLFRLADVLPERRDQLPATLSATGLFASFEPLEPAPAFVPFSVNFPFWSDGADKQRWIAAPPHAPVNVADPQRFEFAPGTIFLKHFEVALDARRPDRTQRLETRVLVCDDRGSVYGAAYRWNAEGTDAELITLTEEVALDRVDREGQPAPQHWQIPGRFGCSFCHNAHAGHVLGFSYRQLHQWTADEDGQPVNQLERLACAGVISQAPAAETLAVHPPLPQLADDSAPLEARARAYLDVNCAACHLPETRYAVFDARWSTPAEQTYLVGGESHRHQELGPDVRIVVPGAPERSMLLLRLQRPEPFLHMPPLGSRAIDPQGVELITRWIQSLGAGAEVAQPGVDAVRR